MTEEKELERVHTPTWADKRLPETVELVKIRGRWWLIQWTDEHAVATADPDRWAFKGELEDCELELWFPPARHVARLVADIAANEEKTP